ncbi:hypothetical protein N8E88_05840 (plasmid) [Phyllobacterium zundukense]|uniref:Uncharacterized protein n=1 Tax=Phyllobacterium zundukense TaxID=1867719 RepID=A0ACD4CXI1_9HYPH|nr:hypothetical protein [Phyllobacterium zundukense]UXN58326.1 hypothetical protein N8E88_05840 [Phyllobacterium zundukense]
MEAAEPTQTLGFARRGSGVAATRALSRTVWLENDSERHHRFNSPQRVRPALAIVALMTSQFSPLSFLARFSLLNPIANVLSTYAEETANADHGSFDPAVGVDDDSVQFTDEQHRALCKRNRLRRYSESLLRRLLGLSATIRRSAYLSRPCPLPP